MAILRIYNPLDVVAILNDILNKNPNHKLARLLLSIMGLQLHRPELICNNPLLLPTLDGSILPYLARLVIIALFEGGNVEGAIREGYEWLRRNYRDIDAHRAYMYLFFRLATKMQNLSPQILVTPTTIEPGCAVQIREEVTKHDEWYCRFQLERFAFFYNFVHQYMIFCQAAEWSVGE